MTYEKLLEDQNEELRKKLCLFESMNLLKIPTLEADVWVDRDEFMLHAVFAVLVEFVDNEWDGKCEPYTNDMLEGVTEESKESLSKEFKEKKELYDLYMWWKKEYPELSKDPKWHIDGYNPETEKLMRVLELRKYLWT